ncbi:endonuclease [Labilibaculum sp.]|uniref:endonuclease/exonuclease/phosphatase family protein n=1 Tax=Labilibaculum sp. TaxID=2060723 RepID=UPI0035612A5D
MKFFLSLFLFFVWTYSGYAQSVNIGSVNEERGDFRFMFYNVENMFDSFDDSLSLDNEFLPMGVRNWTWEKYQRKSQKIAKVFLAAGGWEFPDLIGLAEVENRFVLDGIFKMGYLNKIGYEIIHRESPDRRGIDVALLYQPETFHPMDTSFLKLFYKGASTSTTREILYVKGKTNTDDILHVFVNHWPSRWGGQLESETKRLEAARLLKGKVAEIVAVNSKALIVIMGDFNDYPNNKSLQKELNALAPQKKYSNAKLYNLAYPFVTKTGLGSHKYQGKWGMLDQFIVSGALLNKMGFLYCAPEDMSLFKPNFLLEADYTYFGQKPFRSFIGYKYNDGFSDHLPIILDLWRK